MRDGEMACSQADGKPAPGVIWKQDDILGTVFEGSIGVAGDALTPAIKGSAYIMAENTLLLEAADPFREGILF